MSSKRNFNIEEVVRNVMEVFWHKGYERASLRELTSAAGVNRQSLYNSVGDKQQLFVRSVLAYMAEVIRPWLSGLEAKGEPRNAIRNLYEDIIAQTLADEARRGCLVVTATVDVAFQGREAQMLVGGAAGEFVQFFERLIEHGKLRGEIDEGVHSQAAAATLFAIVIAMRVVARGNYDRALMEQMAEQAMSLVPPPRTGGEGRS